MKRVEWTVGDEVVRGQLYTPGGKRSKPVPLIVLIHGLASSSVEFYDFPEKLVAGGYAALTLDYRGHGKSDGDRGILSKGRVREDLEGALEAMKSEYQVDTERVLLLGHSTGGAMAVCTANDLPQVKALIALAPVARLRDEMNLFEFAGYNAARLVNAPIRIFSKKGISVPYKVDYKRLYSTEAAVTRARKDQFLQTTIPVRNYGPLVQKLDAEECAKKVQIPALVMVAEYDVVVGKESSRRVYEALAGPKKFVEVPRSGHSMCGDARNDFVAKICLEFADRHLLGIPAAA